MIDSEDIYDPDGDRQIDNRPKFAKVHRVEANSEVGVAEADAAEGVVDSEDVPVEKEEVVVMEEEGMEVAKGLIVEGRVDLL